MSSCLLLPGLSQPIRGFPAIETGTFQSKTHQHDVALPIKVSAYICSGHLISVLKTGHLISVLGTGNFVVGWKVGLSQHLAATSNSKNAFLSFA